MLQQKKKRSARRSERVAPAFLHGAEDSATNHDEVPNDASQFDLRAAAGKFMISQKEFVRQLRQLATARNPAGEAKRLSEAYQELLDSMPGLGSQRPLSHAMAIMQTHLKTVASRDKQAGTARKQAAKLFVAAERLHRAAMQREALANTALTAAAESRRAGQQARSTTAALRSVLTAWERAGATPTLRLRNLIELQTAARAADPAAPPLPASMPAAWGTFSTALRVADSSKQVAALLAQSELLPPYPKVLEGVLHPSVLTEGK